MSNTNPPNNPVDATGSRPSAPRIAGTAPPGLGARSTAQRSSQPTAARAADRTLKQPTRRFNVNLPGLAARFALSAFVAIVCFFQGEQISLRWESTGFEALGAVNLASGQTFYGRIGMDWSGDFVIRSTTDEEGQPSVAVAVSSLRTLTLTDGPTNGSPWRLITGLILSLAAAGGAGWVVFRSKRWRASPKAA